MGVGVSVLSVSGGAYVGEVARADVCGGDGGGVLRAGW